MRRTYLYFFAVLCASPSWAISAIKAIDEVALDPIPYKAFHDISVDGFSVMAVRFFIVLPQSKIFCSFKLKMTTPQFTTSEEYATFAAELEAKSDAVQRAYFELVRLRIEIRKRKKEAMMEKRLVVVKMKKLRAVKKKRMAEKENHGKEMTMELRKARRKMGKLIIKIDMEKLRSENEKLRAEMETHAAEKENAVLKAENKAEKMKAEKENAVLKAENKAEKLAKALEKERASSIQLELLQLKGGLNVRNVLERAEEIIKREKGTSAAHLSRFALHQSYLTEGGRRRPPSCGSAL